MLDLNLNGWESWTGWSQYAYSDNRVQSKIHRTCFAFLDSVIRQTISPNVKAPIHFYQNTNVNEDIEKMIEVIVDSKNLIKDLTASCQYHIPVLDDLYGEELKIEFYSVPNTRKKLAVGSVSDYGPQLYILG